MTDEIVDVVKTDAEKAADEVVANIATAKHLHHTAGQDLHRVAAWLVATTRGVIRDLDEAIEAIGHKL